jgi:hypothetical protein
MALQTPKRLNDAVSSPPPPRPPPPTTTNNKNKHSHDRRPLAGVRPQHQRRHQQRHRPGRPAVSRPRPRRRHHRPVAQSRQALNQQCPHQHAAARVRRPRRVRRRLAHVNAQPKRDAWYLKRACVGGGERRHARRQSRARSRPPAPPPRPKTTPTHFLKNTTGQREQQQNLERQRRRPRLSRRARAHGHRRAHRHPHHVGRLHPADQHQRPPGPERRVERPAEFSGARDADADVVRARLGRQRCLDLQLAPRAQRSLDGEKSEKRKTRLALLRCRPPPPSVFLCALNAALCPPPTPHNKNNNKNNNNNNTNRPTPPTPWPGRSPTARRRPTTGPWRRWAATSERRMRCRATPTGLVSKRARARRRRCRSPAAGGDQPNRRGGNRPALVFGFCVGAPGPPPRSPPPLAADRGPSF